MRQSISKHEAEAVVATSTLRSMGVGRHPTPFGRVLAAMLSVLCLIAAPVVMAEEAEDVLIVDIAEEDALLVDPVEEDTVLADAAEDEDVLAEEVAEEEEVVLAELAEADDVLLVDFASELAIDDEEAIVFQEIPSVYGVSRFEQKVTEAPSFVTLITSEDIRTYGWRTLAEALSSVTGFFVTYDRNYNYLGVRGFNRPGDFNTRMLVLVDGHRLNDNLYQQGALGTESPIDVDLIDRIEVIRGPSSSVYGTNAFLGVINVITKRGRDFRGLEVSGEVGSYETYRGRATYGDKFSNGLELLVSGAFYSSEGQDVLFYPEYNDPANNDGLTFRADDDQFPTGFAKISYDDFTVQAGFISREKGIPTGAYGTAYPTNRTRSLDQRAYVFAKYEHQFDSDMNILARVYYDRFYYRGDYLLGLTDFGVPPTPPFVLNRDRSVGEWWGGEARVNKRLFDAHVVTAGFEYRDNFRQDLRNFNMDPRETFLDEDRDQRNFGIFVQDEWTIIENLILNAGVRYDYYESFGSTVNPRLALIYNLEQTTLKALYGTAFRGPNAYERFYEGTGFSPNPNLDPETIETYELVAEHSITRYLRGTVAGYFYRIDDLVSQEDTGSGLIFQNRGKTQAMGLEFQIEMDERGPLGIAGKFGYALQETEDRRTDGRLTNSPSHLINLNLKAPLWRDKLYAGLEVLYASKRKTLGGYFTDDYSVTNLTLSSKNIVKGLEVSGSVRNLFDRDYSDPGSGDGVHIQDEIEQDGRTFWLKVKYGF